MSSQGYNDPARPLPPIPQLRFDENKEIRPHPGPHQFSRSPSWETLQDQMYINSSSSSSLRDGNEGHSNMNNHGDTDIEKLVDRTARSSQSITQHGDDQHHGHANGDEPRPKLGWKARMHHFTWAWFTLPMSTGGLSLLIFAQPNQFPGLRSIGLAVYIINLIIFTCVFSSMVVRFFLHPGDFSASMKHRREGFFFPTFFLSIATLITSTHRYAIPDNDVTLNWFIQAVFWGYLVATLMLAIGQYSYVFGAQTHGLQTMMPTWILPIFPIMLSGTIASVIAGTQPTISAVPIVVAGLICQGLGMLVSMMMYAHMVGRLMAGTLPDREHRPGLFMCVGPPAFTALAVVGMANNIPADFDIRLSGVITPGSPGMGEKAVVQILAYMLGTSLWGLSLWWFGIAVIAVVRSPPKDFHLGWWAMVFPNTGFILATISLGKAFGSDAVGWVATGMSICLLCMYLFVLFHHVKAVINQDIMYPGRDEDYADH
ncbi:hypothetical protein PpBr36_02191 [Pyricularia pennisetigena]|uniref:hypothetical protein n=1 Tax=Pyricularia pennisetigena TaxID=1578925 RepID=UPI0011500ACB|nr:hypothetical protein PpBr36_02191 [Pyricularia pennisetigena]TLS31133.1 hypothetical protein PpBr36_02191 [Pyricularia pennisetigena]